MAQRAGLISLRGSVSFPASLLPLAVRMAKESLNKGLDIASLKDAAQVDIYRFMLLGQTEDSREAHPAWREKRKPAFRGR